MRGHRTCSVDASLSKGMSPLTGAEKIDKMSKISVALPPGVFHIFQKHACRQTLDTQGFEICRETPLILFEKYETLLADYINRCVKALCFFMFRYVPVCTIIKVGVFHIFQKLHHAYSFGTTSLRG